MDKKEKIILVGTGEFARIAYEYFTHDSNYEVAAFSVEKDFIQTKEMYGLPIIPFEALELHFKPDSFKIFIAITYTRLNRVRTRLYNEAKNKGFSFASYISSRAFVWNNAQIGENCFIFENNVIQPFVKIGNNVILWSGNHVGHSSVLKDHCYLSSHVVVSGYCEIGESCFLGVNCTIGDHVKLADDCFINAGTLILKNTETGKIYQGIPAEICKVDTYRFFKIKQNLAKI